MEDSTSRSVDSQSQFQLQGLSSESCCVCLKSLRSCKEEPVFHRTRSATVRVCSFPCEQSVLRVAGFAQGFALSSVLLRLFAELLAVDVLPDQGPGTVPGLTLTLRQPLPVKDENDVPAWCGSRESPDPAHGVGLADCGEALDLEDSISADAPHAASYDSSTECESLDLNVSFRETETSTNVLPKKCSARVAVERGTTLCTTRDPKAKSKTKKRFSVSNSEDKKSISKTKIKVANAQQTGHGKKQTLALKKQSADASVRQKGKLSTKSVHFCECGEVFSCKKLFQRHRRTHGHHANKDASSGHQPKCEVCTRVFQSRWHLKYHTKRKHSGEGQLECDVCGKLLCGAFDLSEHKRKAHSDNYLCDICGSKFFSSSALAGHLATHAGIKRFFCEECGMGFVRRSSLTNHQALHAKVAAFLCHVCSQSFKTRTRLYDHMMNLHHCGPYFDNRVRRLKTMGILVDREAVSKLTNGLCSVCSGKLTSGACPLHPGSAQQAFKCTLCGRSESDIVSLCCHSKWHRGESEDGSSVATASLPSHGLLSYECPTCFKKFRNKNYLIKHMQQHKDKRFACDTCGKSFTYKCNLKSHRTTHSQSRPFECGVCHKAFKLKYTLDIHQRHHCREVDAFKCEVCGKGLIRKESLVKHYRTVHPESGINVSFDAYFDS